MHKRILILLTLAIMVFAASASAWEQSFRASTSDMLFWGDFDNDLDPIYIHDNQGYRFYSILSNLTSYQNMFLSNYYGADDNTFLIGASGQFGLPTKFPWESRTAFVIQLADNTSPQSSGLDNDLFGSVALYDDGQQNATFTEEQTWNSTTNSFDYRRTNTSAVDAYRIWKSRDWQLTHSYTDGSKTIGLAFKHSGFGNNYYEDNLYPGTNSTLYFDLSPQGQYSRQIGFEYLDPMHNWSYNNTEVRTDMSTASPTVLYRGSRVGDFSNWNKSPENNLVVSYQMPFSPIANSDIRFDIAYNNRTDEGESHWMTKRTDFNSDPGGFGEDSASATESLSGTYKGSGSMFTPAVQLTKNWSPETYSWFRFDLGFGSKDYIMNGSRTYMSRLHSVAGDFVRDTTEAEAISIDGSIDRTYFSFYHKTVHEFSPNFRFAAGLDFEKGKDDMSDVPYTRSFSRAVNNIAGTAFDDAADFRDSLVVSESGKFSSTTKSTVAMFPVALEYVQGKWTFRLGGTHRISKYTYEDNFVQNGLPVKSVDTTYLGDGTDVNGPNVQSGGTYWNQNRTSEEKHYQTWFYYGLQFMPNPNMKIELVDFLGDYAFKSTGVSFIDAQYFASLRMSITILW